MDTDSGAAADYKIAEKNNPRLMIELLIVNMPKGEKQKLNNFAPEAFLSQPPENISCVKTKQTPGWRLYLLIPLIS